MGPRHKYSVDLLSFDCFSTAPPLSLRRTKILEFLLHSSVTLTEGKHLATGGNIKLKPNKNIAFKIFLTLIASSLSHICYLVIFVFFVSKI